MSEKRARYIGHQDGCDLTIPVGNGGDIVTRHIAYGGELPNEIGGQRVPAAFRDGLLEQEANWTEVKRATGDEATGKAAKGGKEDED